MSASSRLREALESALVEGPDDLATHMAYADHLVETGDPRGEFIQVQLALEDPKRKRAERKQLQRRERELLDAHEREWLGELAPLLLGTPEEQRALIGKELTGEAARGGYWMEHLVFLHSWSRGWLDRFECGLLSVETARKLGRHPLARLLRAFVYRHGYGTGSFRAATGPDVPGPPGCYTVEILAHYPILSNIRFFQYGREADPEEDTYDVGTQFERLAPLVERMPRLEELSIFGHIYGREAGRPDLSRIVSLWALTNLRVFRHYHGHVYPLEVLAANPALGRLTHLLCFPHSFAGEYDPDLRRITNTVINRDNVRAVATSPHLPALTHLQLRCCSGGDATIEDIVGSGILKRLRSLDLRHGHVTDAGARLLADCPDARNLEVLDLINNRLTPQGIAALQAAGVRVRADRQQEPPFDNDRILYYGDSE
jgi:uncharacterized protein (TIGR02996 family)